MAIDGVSDPPASATRTRTDDTARARTSGADGESGGAAAVGGAAASDAPGAASRVQVSADAQAAARRVAAGGDAAARASARAFEAPAAPADGPQSDVKRGDGGDDVKALQRKLNDSGARPPLNVDGIFGPKTERATKAYQKQNGLHPDGVAGPLTRGKINGTDASAPTTPATPTTPTTPATPTTPVKPGDVTLAPKGASEEQKWQHYADIIKAQGGKVPGPGDKPTVLAIRGIDSNGNKHESTNNRKYDDTMVVLTGDHHVTEMKGSTHAGQLTTSLVDHVGRIDPGNYTATSQGADKHNGMHYYRVTTQSGSGNIPGVRDINNDGHYSQSEVDRAKQKGTTMDGILVHVGFASSPKSIGCLTLPPAEMQRLLARAPGGFNITLVDGSR